MAFNKVAIASVLSCIKRSFKRNASSIYKIPPIALCIISSILDTNFPSMLNEYVSF